MRLTARLLDVADGTALWSDRFDRPLADFFPLQDALASDLVDALAIQLSGPAKARLLKRDTDNVEAWQLYVNGRYHWDRRNDAIAPDIDSYDGEVRRDRPDGAEGADHGNASREPAGPWVR